MGTRYNIAITATDAATARVRAIKQAIRGVVAPITQTTASVKALGKEVGFHRLAGGLRSLGTVATSTLRSIGAISPAMAGIGGIGTIAAVGTYTKIWSDAATATLRFAAASGLATSRVQTLSGAAKLAGYSVDEMEGAVLNLGTTMQDARWGRNQGALLMMNRLGLRMKYTRDGAVDTRATLRDLADILQKMRAPVQTKQLIADTFGVGNLLPLLLKGGAALDEYERKAAKLKPPISDEDLKKADQLREKITGIGMAFENLGNGIMVRVGPTVGGWLDYWIRRINITADQIRKNGFWNTMGTNTAHNLTGVFRPPKDDRPGPLGDWNKLFGIRGPSKADPRAEKESIDDFKRMGWTDAQAKGIVANMIAESHLDPKAVGDGGQAKGALQWHPDRQRNYAAWAKSRDDVKGKTIDSASLADQRKFIDFELRKGAEKKAGQHLAQQTDAKAAAAFLSEDYVRPRDHLGEMSHRAKTAQALDQRHPEGQGVAKNDLPSVWKQKPQTVKTESTVNVKITGLPAGAKAEVVDSAGPVKTTLKLESSMPDYNL